MIKLGLIGEGIAQSQSPDLHQRLGQTLNVPVDYQLFDALDIPDFSFEAQVETLRAAGYAGVNVTYPFKERAIKLADTVSEGASMVGSSNTLLFADNKIHAENTDFSGFIRAFRYTFPDEKPGPVLMIGGGGVGRAVACGLAKLECSQLYLLEMDPARGAKLASELCDLGLPTDVVSADDIAQIAGSVEGIINCSPVGHINHPGCPIEHDLIQPNHWVFDAVYIPAMTELLSTASKVGATRISGIDLFLYQGLDAFKHFTKAIHANLPVYDQADEFRKHYFSKLESSK